MAAFLGQEIDFPFTPGAGAVTGLSTEAILIHGKQVLASPAPVLDLGSFTMNRHEGNAHYGKTYDHNKLTGETVNSIYFENVGIQEAEQKIIPELSRIARDCGKKLIVSVSALAGEDATNVLPELSERVLEAGADVVETNYSCPNKFTLAGELEPILCNDPGLLEEAHSKVAYRIGDALWLEKFGPYIDELEFLVPSVIAAVSKVRYANGAVISNSIPGQQLYDNSGRPALGVPNNKGGLSGPATKHIARKQLSLMRRAFPSEVEIVSALGVVTGYEVAVRERMGANLSMGVTALTEGGANYGKTISRMASEYLDVVDEVQRKFVKSTGKSKS